MAIEQTLLKTSPKGWHWVSSTWAKLAALVGIGGAAVLTFLYTTQVEPRWVKLAALSGIGGTAAVAVLTFFYASQIEPRWFDFRTHHLHIRNLPVDFRGYRIVQISDLHLDTHKVLTPDRLDRLVQQINQLHPDLILITGDLVTNFNQTSRVGISCLKKLRATDGIYAVLGNHDHWASTVDVINAADEAGIRILCNEHVVIQRRRDNLVIAGLEDAWEGNPNLDLALWGAPDGDPVVVMVHEPNYADIVAQDERVVLQLSGHSHGGQVRVPGLGPLALPDQAWRYPMGLYQVQNMLLYVSRGTGSAEIPLRFNCRPEIATFVLDSR